MHRFPLLLFFLLSPLFLFSEIIELPTMEAIRSRIGPLDRETLLVFDVDNTLTIPADPSFQMPNIREHRSLVKNLTKNWSEEEKQIGLNYMVLLESVLLDNATGYWIHQLQDYQIPVMAFSGTLTSPLGSFVYPYIRKEQLLLALNVNFFRTTPIRENFILESIPPSYGTHPLFQNGILHGNGADKGEVFLAFLEKLAWKPKKVIFIDDDRENLLSMEKNLKEKEIPFEGFYFTGSQTLRTSPVPSSSIQQQWSSLVTIVKTIMDEKELCLPLT